MYIYTYIYVSIHKYENIQIYLDFFVHVHVLTMWLPPLKSTQTATHHSTPQHTTTHHNTPQHTATHCNTLHHTATRS